MNRIAKAEVKVGSDDADSAPRVRELEREVWDLKPVNDTLKPAGHGELLLDPED